MYDGKNVSNESVIMVTEDNVGEISNLPSPEFATFRPGEYRFRATYKDKVSNIFKLTVTSTSEVSDFFKKTLFTYHTATWCTKCPAAHKDLLSVMAKYPGRSVKISIHGQDDLEVEQGKQLMSAFSVQGFPSIFCDYSKNNLYGVAGAPTYENALLNSQANNPAVCGIKLETKVDIKTEQGKNVAYLITDLTAKFNETSEYKLVIALTESIPDGKGGEIKDVLRGTLTSILGDDLGVRKMGETYTHKTITTKIPLGLVERNKTIMVAYLLKKSKNGSYSVNNATDCLIGTSQDFLYETKQNKLITNE